MGDMTTCMEQLGIFAFYGNKWNDGSDSGDNGNNKT